MVRTSAECSTNPQPKKGKSLPTSDGVQLGFVADQSAFVMLNEVKHLGLAGEAPDRVESTYTSVARDPPLTLRMTESARRRH
jgi:hypothetical protein